jgi:hypothetical protein
MLNSLFKKQHERNARLPEGELERRHSRCEKGTENKRSRERTRRKTSSTNTCTEIRSDTAKA